MKHPMLANWIEFERVSQNEYIVTDLLTDTRLRTDAHTAWFVRRLNGRRDPYRIDRKKSKAEVDALLAELENNNIIRERRFVCKSLLQLLVTVWQPRMTARLRTVSVVANILLMILWLPLLLFSLYYYFTSSHDSEMVLMLPGMGIGALLGLTLHELSHLFACVAYGGRAFDVGVMLYFFIPGAYVLMSDTDIKKRMQRVQVKAAGIEMNFLLTAVFLILAAWTGDFYGLLVGAAFQNAFLAFLNMTLIGGFDGAGVISELCGCDDLMDRVKKVTGGRKKRKRLCRDGFSGIATVAFCYILRFAQCAFPVLLLLNVTGGILWFM